MDYIWTVGGVSGSHRVPSFEIPEEEDHRLLNARISGAQSIRNFELVKNIFQTQLVYILLDEHDSPQWYDIVHFEQ